MNPSAIVMLIVSLALFIGGILYCISRVIKAPPPGGE